MRHFIVVTPDYTPRYGGIVALHQLAHELRQLGEAVFLWPSDFRFDPDSPRAHLRAAITGGYGLARLRRIWPAPFGNTHTLSGAEDFDVEYGLPAKLGTRDERIVIYPETVYGNPLQAKHRVRWLLHEPGFFDSRFELNTKEYYVRYASFFNKFSFLGMNVRSRPLQINHIPECFLRGEEAGGERNGVVYSIRKGHKNFDPSLVEGGLCLDELELPEIAEHFRKAKRYITFDTRTFLTRMAVLCGTEVIVVPEPGVTEDEWHPDARQRYGVAWGFDEEQL